MSKKSWLTKSNPVQLGIHSKARVETEGEKITGGSGARRVQPIFLLFSPRAALSVLSPMSARPSLPLI